MKDITIPIRLSSDVMSALDESKKDLEKYFQAGIAMLLFKKGKLSFGKAQKLSGLSRFEFENLLSENNISFSNPSIEEVFADSKKL